METVLKQPTIIGGAKEIVRTPAFDADFVARTESEQLAIADISSALPMARHFPLTLTGVGC